MPDDEDVDADARRVAAAATDDAAAPSLPSSPSTEEERLAALFSCACRGGRYALPCALPASHPLAHNKVPCQTRDDLGKAMMEGGRGCTDCGAGTRGAERWGGKREGGGGWGAGGGGHTHAHTLPQTLSLATAASDSPGQH